ncbi:hypothetical protein L0Y65_05880 [Candidatus Micrarchaeota archaeon]|nr:hypothetical protein [Candidatus Micrarchaeota archaeon]
MPKEAFGGDDGGSPAPEKRKLGLGKFGLSPDTNIRDIFWRVLGGYAAAKKPGVDLSTLENDRFALVRVAIAVLSTQQGERYGLAPKFIAIYSLMMIIDGGWNDALVEFLEMACEKKLGIRKEASHAMKKLLAHEKYGKALSESLAAMVRGRDTGPVALEYLADMDSPQLASAMKKELMIIARGDIGQNQLNAIKAISQIRDDPEIRKSLVILLSHWDAQARLAAAEVLLEIADDGEVRQAAEKRLAAETDEEIRKLLQRIAGK